MWRARRPARGGPPVDYGDKLLPCQWYIFTPPQQYIFAPPLTGFSSPERAFRAALAGRGADSGRSTRVGPGFQAPATEGAKRSRSMRSRPNATPSASSMVRWPRSGGVRMRPSDAGRSQPHRRAPALSKVLQLCQRYTGAETIPNTAAGEHRPAGRLLSRDYPAVRQSRSPAFLQHERYNGHGVEEGNFTGD